MMVVGILLALLLGVGTVVGAGYYYYGRWVDTQSHYVPVKEPISVKTVEESIPEWIYPGDTFTMEYEVTNSNKNSPYEMTNTFYGDWEVVKDCAIRVYIELHEEPIPRVKVFEKTFTANDTVKATDMKTTGMTTMAVGMSNYCEVPYTIPADGKALIEVTVNIRNDAPTAPDYLFNYYFHTYRGRDEEPLDWGKG